MTCECARLSKHKRRRQYAVAVGSSQYAVTHRMAGRSVLRTVPCSSGTAHTHTTRLNSMKKVRTGYSWSCSRNPLPFTFVGEFERLPFVVVGSHGRGGTQSSFEPSSTASSILAAGRLTLLNTARGSTGKPSDFNSRIIQR